MTLKFNYDIRRELRMKKTEFERITTDLKILNYDKHLKNQLSFFNVKGIAKDAFVHFDDHLNHGL